MSQPLSNLMGGQKRPIEPDPTNTAMQNGRKVEVNYTPAPEEEDVAPRTLPLRDTLVLILVLVGVTCVAGGLSILWGIGAGLVGVGACVLILAVLLGLM